jgi:hypothetical protein
LFPYRAHMCWWICPLVTSSGHKNMYHISLLLLGAILKFRCYVHRFVATLLPCRLVTYTLQYQSPRFPLFPFYSKI